MMNFRTVKVAINTILNGGATAGEFSVIGYPQNDVSADLVNKKRQVVCFYQSGAFPSGSGGMNSDTHQHQAKYSIVLRVAVKCADTDDGFLSSGQRADDEMDDLIDVVYQLLMKGENLFLGTENDNGLYPTVSSRELPNIEKSAFEEKGEYAVMSATMMLNAQMAETVVSTTGLEIEDVENNLSFDDDDVGLQGTKTVY